VEEVGRSENRWRSAHDHVADQFSILFGWLIVREYESGILVSSKPSWVSIALLFLKYASNTNKGTEAPAERVLVFRPDRSGDDKSMGNRNINEYDSSHGPNQFD
jgi:hypothetical protein